MKGSVLFGKLNQAVYAESLKLFYHTLEHCRYGCGTILAEK